MVSGQGKGSKDQAYRVAIQNPQGLAQYNQLVIDQLAESLMKRHDLLDGLSSEERKRYPVETGFYDYFRDAIMRIARVSYEGNQKHNPGEPTHWARGKSDDHGDCAARHMLCNDDEEHLANAAWRVLAELQLYLEKRYNIAPPPGVR
jgi:hypothetical protein